MSKEDQQSKIAISIMNVILQEVPETEKTKEYVSELFDRCLSYAQNELNEKPGRFKDLDLS